MPKDLLKGLGTLGSESDDLPRSRLSKALEDEPDLDDEAEDEGPDDAELEAASSVRAAIKGGDDAALIAALKDLFSYWK
jgi:hypothetical protein